MSTAMNVHYGIYIGVVYIYIYIYIYKNTNRNCLYIVRRERSQSLQSISNCALRYGNRGARTMATRLHRTAFCHSQVLCK